MSVQDVMFKVLSVFQWCSAALLWLNSPLSGGMATCLDGSLTGYTHTLLMLNSDWRYREQQSACRKSSQHSRLSQQNWQFASTLSCLGQEVDWLADSHDWIKITTTCTATHCYAVAPAGIGSNNKTSSDRYLEVLRTFRGLTHSKCFNNSVFEGTFRWEKHYLLGSLGPWGSAICLP